MRSVAEIKNMTEYVMLLHSIQNITNKLGCPGHSNSMGIVCILDEPACRMHQNIIIYFYFMVMGKKGH